MAQNQEGFMVMNDHKKSYDEILENMGTPLDIDSIPNRVIDYKALISYAKSKGVRVYELPMEERKKFLISSISA